MGAQNGSRGSELSLVAWRDEMGNAGRAIVSHGREEIAGFVTAEGLSAMRRCLQAFRKLLYPGTTTGWHVEFLVGLLLIPSLFHLLYIIM